MEENLEWRRKLELLCFSVALGIVYSIKQEMLGQRVSCSTRCNTIDLVHILLRALLSSYRITHTHRLKIE